MLPSVPDSTSSRALSELSPEIGQNVTVQFIQSKKRFSLNFIGFKAEKSVIISAPRGQVNTLALEGAQVNVSMQAGNYHCRFTSRLVKAHHAPFPHWHLSFPTQVETSRLRQYDRIPVRMAVSVDHEDEMKSSQLGLPRVLLCRDIGLGGVSIESPERLGQVGDRFYLTLRFRVHRLDQVVLLSAVLRSVQQSVGGVVMQGFEFESMEEDSQLLVSAFVYQQYLTELGYLRDE
ncbi:flagellar brake protein [Neptunomonas marina]|uniref:Flagellar brake protein n=1 Tax=Neptunomonas marina TaxID=1815562 RepID=A0A437Q813_9GAMM|nr:flagellar brake protein [Neptunomonas marina]RVU30619.1 flagellar brake protein [Neptunomonas marina]